MANRQLQVVLQPHQVPMEAEYQVAEWFHAWDWLIEKAAKLQLVEDAPDEAVADISGSYIHDTPVAESVRTSEHETGTPTQ